LPAGFLDDDEKTPIMDSLALASQIHSDRMSPSGAAGVTELEARLLEKPDEIPTLKTLARLYEERGQTAEAIRIHLKIGNLHVSAHRHRSAMPHLSRALELNDDNIEAKELLAQIYAHLGQTTGAILLLKDLVSTFERNGDLSRLRAALSQLRAVYDVVGDQINAFRTQLHVKDIDEVSAVAAIDRACLPEGAIHPPRPKIPVPRPTVPVAARRRLRGRAWVLVLVAVAVAVAVAAVGAWRLSPTHESSGELLSEAAPPRVLASSITVEKTSTAIKPTESAATATPFSAAASTVPAPARAPAPEEKPEVAVEAIFPGGFSGNHVCFSTLNPWKLAELDASLAACTGTILVNGYAAQNGSEAFRREVSEKRAECVKQRLQKSKALAERDIIAAGHLDAFPPDPGGRKKKRGPKPWVTVECR